MPHLTTCAAKKEQTRALSVKDTVTLECIDILDIWLTQCIFRTLLSCSTVILFGYILHV